MRMSRVEHNRTEQLTMSIYVSLYLKMLLLFPRLFHLYPVNIITAFIYGKSEFHLIVSAKEIRCLVTPGVVKNLSDPFWNHFTFFISDHHLNKSLANITISFTIIY